MNVCLIVLPFPSAKLNPNRSKGLHWGATTALRKDARQEAYLLAKNALRAFAADFKGCESVALTITFHAPDRRNRDRDNLLAALKPSLDGVADALGVNDSQFNPITIQRGESAKGGSVRVEVA